MAVLFEPAEFAKLKEHLVLYRCALQSMRTRVDIFLQDYAHLQPYNPIEHVKERVKTPESIAAKLDRRGFKVTADNARYELTDVAGIRCICSYARDIFPLADVFKRLTDVTVISEKDYVTNPKPSGYRSYHLIMEVPIFLTNMTHHVPVEVQIRTSAMDFWASLEHKARYKFHNQMPGSLSQDLLKCAEKIAELDNQMYLIQELADMTR